MQGVSQGSILLLFTLFVNYMNDLKDFVNIDDLYQYPDNTTIIFYGNNLQEVSRSLEIF